MPTTRRKRANPPDEPDGNNSINGQPAGGAEPAPTAEPAPAADVEKPDTNTPPVEPPATESFVPTPAQHVPTMNGDRFAAERQEYPPTPEPARRTSFRRPAQPATPAQQPPAPTPAPPPAATHEITLPLGNLLHLAYNPAYTGSEEARSTLLNRLAHESETGGRGRCWNCGSLAIVYDCWNTRSRNLGDVGVAICEVCGVWSVL